MTNAEYEMRKDKPCMTPYDHTEQTKQTLLQLLTVVALARQTKTLPVDSYQLEALTQDIEFLLCRITRVEVDVSE